MREIKKVSKAFFVGSLIVFFVASVILGLIDMTELLIILIIYIGIVWLVLLYKSWEAIQDGKASTTPGKAVGFLFIPFFNLYWIFRAVGNFPLDFNKFVKRHKIVAAKKLPEGLFLFYCVFTILSGLFYGGIAVFPILEIAIGLIAVILLLILIIDLCNAINALAEWSSKKKK